MSQSFVKQSTYPAATHAALNGLGVLATEQPASATSSKNSMQPCAHCGWQPLDGALDNIVYATGLHGIWLDVGRPEQAMYLQKVPGHPSMAQWGAQCLESRGGCGAKVWGLGRDGAIAAWNRRPDAAWLQPDDMQALQRFCETSEDSQPYDVPKDRMRRLAELGVIQWCGASRYTITAFGQYVLDLLPDGWPRTPLKTHADHNAYASAEINKASGNAGVTACSAPHCGCMNQGGPGPCAAKQKEGCANG